MLRTLVLAHALAMAGASGPGSTSEPRWASPRQTSPVETPPPAVLYSARVEFGLGLFASQAGMSVEAWLRRWLSVGLHGAWCGMAWPFAYGGRAYGAGATLGTKTPGARSYGYLSLMAGVAEYHVTRYGGLCLDWYGDGGCEPPVSHSGFAPLLGGSLGWLFHPGGVELGPLLRLDQAGPLTAFTLNLALGFGGTE
jgi:hypothetical protein